MHKIQVHKGTMRLFNASSCIRFQAQSVIAKASFAHFALVTECIFIFQIRAEDGLLQVGLSNYAKNFALSRRDLERGTDPEPEPVKF